MPKLAGRKKASVHAEVWSLCLEGAEVPPMDAWEALAWAEKSGLLEKAQPLVTAERAEADAVAATVLRLLSAPPSEVSSDERIKRAAACAAKINHPLVHTLHGVMCTEAGQTRAALEVFERLKCVGSAFPEVPLIAGRALMHAAGTDSKLLHKAEWYLKHAEHLCMDGDGADDAETEQDAEWSDAPEPMEVEIAVDSAAQARLSEIWQLMATLYQRLGDAPKSEMYRGRAGAVVEEEEEDDGGEGDFVAEEYLKPADRKLLRAFLLSPQYTALSPRDQEQAMVSLPYCVAFGRVFLGVAPNRLDRYALEELMVAVIPEKLVADHASMGRIPTALTAWLHFLGKAGVLRDAGRLVPLVQKFAADFMTNCRDKNCWGAHKTVAMRAVLAPSEEEVLAG